MTIFIFVILLLLLGGAAFAFRVKIKEVVSEAAVPELPQARTYQPAIPGSGTDIRGPGAENDDTPEEPAPSEAPESEVEDRKPVSSEAEGSNVDGEVNWSVPFTPQAPHANWSLPYQEACEEASVLMVNAWLSGAPAGAMDPDAADREILDLVEWQNERFGYYKDTNAEETAIIAREYYGYEGTEVLPVTSIEDVKARLAAGHPVILPAAGQELYNPYFRGSGPLYHMLVAKGYTEDGHIITNDPGSRRGEDFLYEGDALYDAIGDWNDGDPANGDKLMIVVKP